MARLDAMSVQLSGGTEPAKLAELYGWVINNVQLKTVSQVLKNKMLSGDPAAGSVEANRFENTSSDEYGTARAAGKGKKGKIKPVVIPIDTKRELIHEVEKYDLKRLGISGVYRRYAALDVESMSRELDVAFFAEAVSAGTKLTTTKTTVRERIEEIALKIEKTKNEFVDGVPRNLIAVTLSQDEASDFRLEIDTLPATDNVLKNGYWTNYHGIDLYISNHLGQINTGTEASPVLTDVSIVAMVYDSVAQPVNVEQHADEQRIALSKAIATELFFDYGTKTVTPDLIHYIAQ